MSPSHKAQALGLSYHAETDAYYFIDDDGEFCWEVPADILARKQLHALSDMLEQAKAEHDEARRSAAQEQAQDAFRDAAPKIFSAYQNQAIQGIRQMQPTPAARTSTLPESATMRLDPKPDRRCANCRSWYYSEESQEPTEKLCQPCYASLYHTVARFPEIAASILAAVKLLPPGEWEKHAPQQSFESFARQVARDEVRSAVEKRAAYKLAITQAELKELKKPYSP